MEGQWGHDDNPLQLISMGVSGNASYVSHTCQDNPNQQQVMAPRRDQMPHMPMPLPHWVHCPQSSQSSVELLAESSGSETRRNMSYYNLGVEFGFKPADSSTGMGIWKGVEYPRPPNGGGPANNFTIAQYQNHVQEQGSSEPHSRAAAAAPWLPPQPHTRMSRQRATATANDRSRRLRIAERLDALQELLPHHKKGSQASLLDDIIDHVKYLQLQIKDLSQSRLGGELTSNPFIFLEGYGHYLIEEQMSNEPLEEMMGKLLEVNPLAATQLLETKGLVIRPMALAEGLPHQAM